MRHSTLLELSRSVDAAAGRCQTRLLSRNGDPNRLAVVQLMQTKRPC